MVLLYTMYNFCKHNLVQNMKLHMAFKRRMYLHQFTSGDINLQTNNSFHQYILFLLFILKGFQRPKTLFGIAQIDNN